MIVLKLLQSRNERSNFWRIVFSSPSWFSKLNVENVGKEPKLPSVFDTWRIEWTTYWIMDTVRGAWIGQMIFYHRSLSVRWRTRLSRLHLGLMAICVFMKAMNTSDVKSKSSTVKKKSHFSRASPLYNGDTTSIENRLWFIWFYLRDGRIPLGSWP